MARYKRRSAGGSAIRLIASIMGLVVLIGGGIALYKHFKPTDKPPVQTGGVIDENGNDITQGVHRPSAMTFLAVNTAGVTVQAVVAPEEVLPEFAKADWSVNFKNPTSAWATGKQINAFISVTPKSDGATEAVVKCLAPFGEPVDLQVTMRSNPEAVATISLNYMKRITDMKLTAKNASGANLSASQGTITALTMNDSFSEFAMAPVYGVGTVTPTIDNFFLRTRASRVFSSAYDLIHDGLVSRAERDMFGSSAPAKTPNIGALPILSVAKIFENGDSSSNKWTVFASGADVLDNLAERNILYSCLKTVENAEDPIGLTRYVLNLMFNAEYSYANVPFENIKYEYRFMVPSSVIGMTPTGVTISGGDINF